MSDATQGLIYFAIAIAVVLAATIVVPLFSRTKLSSGSVPVPTGRGGVMGWIARTVTMSLARITFASLHFFENLGVDMATIDEAIAGFTAWGQGWKDKALAEQARADAAVAALTDAQAAAQKAADDLAAFQADDAATDAAQLAQQAQDDADKVQAALDAVKAADVPPAPPAEPPADVPPADTPPADVPPADTPPADVPPADGGGDTPPE